MLRLIFMLLCLFVTSTKKIEIFGCFSFQFAAFPSCIFSWVVPDEPRRNVLDRTTQRRRLWQSDRWLGCRTVSRRDVADGREAASRERDRESNPAQQLWWSVANQLYHVASKPNYAKHKPKVKNLALHLWIHPDLRGLPCLLPSLWNRTTTNKRQKHPIHRTTWNLLWLQEWLCWSSGWSDGLMNKTVAVWSDLSHKS